MASKIYLPSDLLMAIGFLRVRALGGEIPEDDLEFHLEDAKDSIECDYAIADTIIKMRASSSWNPGSYFRASRVQKRLEFARYYIQRHMGLFPPEGLQRNELTACIVCVCTCVWRIQGECWLRKMPGSEWNEEIKEENADKDFVYDVKRRLRIPLSKRIPFF